MVRSCVAGIAKIATQTVRGLCVHFGANYLLSNGLNAVVGALGIAKLATQTVRSLYARMTLTSVATRHTYSM